MCLQLLYVFVELIPLSLCSVSLYNILNILCYFLLACRVTLKSAGSLMGVPVKVTYCFSLAIFSYSLFILNFCHFNYNVSWCGPLSVDLVWDSLCFLDLNVCFLSQVRVCFCLFVFNYCISYMFSTPFSFPYASRISIIWMLVCLMSFQRSLKMSFLFYSLFFLASVVSTNLPAHWSVLLLHLIHCQLLLVYFLMLC